MPPRSIGLVRSVRKHLRGIAGRIDRDRSCRARSVPGRPLCDATQCVRFRTDRVDVVKRRTVLRRQSRCIRVERGLMCGSPVDASNRTSYTLPPELIVEASRRLGWLGLVYAGALIATSVGRRALLGMDGAGRTRHSLRAPLADRDDGNCRLRRIAQRHAVTEATARPGAGLRSRRRVRHCRRTTLGRRSPTV